MIAQNVPSAQVPAMAREDSAHYTAAKRVARPLTPGERLDMLVEATRAARREIQIDGHDIHPLAVFVLIELQKYHNKDTGTAKPSQKRIGRQLGATPAAISRAIQELVNCGYITRIRRGRAIHYAFRGPLFDDLLEAPEDEEDTSEVVPQDNSQDTCDLSPRTTVQDSTVVPQSKPELSPRATPYKNPEKEPGTTSSPTVSTKPPGTSTTAEESKVAQKSGKPRQTLIPDDFEPTEEMIQKMVAKRMSRGEILEETEQFKLYHVSKGTVRASWPASWYVWMNNNKPGGRFYKSSSQKQRPNNLGPTLEETQHPEFYDGYDYLRGQIPPRLRDKEEQF